MIFCIIWRDHGGRNGKKRLSFLGRASKEGMANCIQIIFRKLKMSVADQESSSVTNLLVQLCVCEVVIIWRFTDRTSYSACTAFHIIGIACSGGEGRQREGKSSLTKPCLWPPLTYFPIKLLYALPPTPIWVNHLITRVTNNRETRAHWFRWLRTFLKLSFHFVDCHFLTLHK
jgi:hypothetical protein